MDLENNMGLDEKKTSKSSYLFFTVMGFVFIFCFVFSILGNIFLSVALVASSAENMNLESSPISFNIKTIEGEGEEEVLVIPLDGIIMDSDSDTTMWMKSIKADNVIRQLKEAEKRTTIKAVLLKINSPGGALHPTDKIYQAILQFKEKTNIPVIAYLDTTAASGGYYIAVACDYIISDSLCITGSIGVIMSFIQAKELLENKLGIKSVVIKSGKHKDIGSVYREVTEKEDEILNNMIQEMYSRFLDVVIKGRKRLAELSIDEVKEIADGRIYTGTQAKELGLVDELGDFKKAISYCRKVGNVRSTKVIQFETKKTIFQEVFANASMSENKISDILKNLGIQSVPPGIYYMWVLE
ncbi:MAG TPA: signal peptide peptidase SppA [Planctomycetota bacterium]|nr:signal peptide peptidase SppA [Planctomycetota bacterium]HPY75935.1 signal peptide peptidase SppA [Planctomycetota bacterium]HQB01480.1 signal peptide peptidase SppA [Planctomycetota bacterium]